MHPVVVSVGSFCSSPSSSAEDRAPCPLAGMPIPEGLSADQRRKYMAEVFAKTQNEMSMTVDTVGIETRRAVPYPSFFTGKSVAETGPIPTDAHLIPSGKTTVRKPLPTFALAEDSDEPLRLSGQPWASYSKPQDTIFLSKPEPVAAAPPRKTRTTAEEEMWRTQYQEWTLQKNAFNPDIAAGLRTNVRKQASLSVPPLDKPQDPARTSENVRAALSHSEITGPTPKHAKSKIDPSVYRPTAGL